MSFRITKRIVIGRLVCLMAGSALFGITAFSIHLSQKRSNPRLTNCPPNGISRSKPSHDDAFTFRCATSFTRSQKLINPCFLEEMRRRFRPRSRSGPIVIQVYFHILTNQAGQGAVPKKAIDDQIKVLNEAFAGTIPGGVPTPFRFVLADTDWKKNDDWFELKYSELNPTQAERDAKAELNKPGDATLNIYTAGIGTLGWARWPWQLADRIDGVIVNFSTLPGMPATHNNNLGDVVVHEVGHWLGLFHTSQNGCRPPGDCVDDTFAEDYPKTGCQKGDSCPFQPGQDPYWNYMNATDDCCRYLFSRDQVARMGAIYTKYRAN